MHYSIFVKLPNPNIHRMNRPLRVLNEFNLLKTFHLYQMIANDISLVKGWHFDKCIGFMSIVWYTRER